MRLALSSELANFAHPLLPLVEQGLDLLRGVRGLVEADAEAVLLTATRKLEVKPVLHGGEFDWPGNLNNSGVHDPIPLSKGSKAALRNPIPQALLSKVLPGMVNVTRCSARGIR